MRMIKIKQALVLLMCAVLTIGSLSTTSVMASSKKDCNTDDTQIQSHINSETQIDYSYFEELGLYHVGYDVYMENTRQGGTWERTPSGNWMYIHEDGSFTTNGWERIDGYWYFFDQSGYMYTGWLEHNGKIYYLNENAPGRGRMVTGWKYISTGQSESHWFYFESNGEMVIGWKYLEYNGTSSWFYFNTSGIMVTGWQYIGSNWYFFNSSGRMQTGWLTRGGYTFYLKPSGAMATGWFNVEGYTYFFSTSGHLMDTTRRAIIVGDHASERIMDMNGWENALSNMTFLEEDFDRIEKEADLTFAEFTALIDDVMSDADSSDITYISLTCHGSQNGALFVCTDQSISGQTLRDLLDQYEGKVVVFLNCCYAGVIINRTDSVYPEMDFVLEFADETDSGELLDNKYMVLCSAAYDELSYKFTNENLYPVYIAYANQFWTLGGGWNLLNSTSTTMGADSNEDYIVSLNELYSYSSTYVTMQHIVVYPTNCEFTLFARN